MAVVDTRGATTPAVYTTAAFGTVAEIMVTDPGALDIASCILHREVDRMERIASRFRTDSEISRVHQAGGHRVPVSSNLLEVLRVALEMAAATDGVVDPTVGRALEYLGYDRDFAEIAAGVPGTLPAARGVPGWRSIDVDPLAGTVRIPAGTCVDLGATAKALAAQWVLSGVLAQVDCGVLVSLGGDIAVGGPPPAEGFVVGVSDVCATGEISATVAIRSGGLATSGIGVRRWHLGENLVHHIIDPTTSLPATVLWRTVSVAAASCVEANAAATAAMIKGDAGVEWLAALGLPARLVGVDGTVRHLAGWPETERRELDLRKVGQ
jgi:thiamine biosynthesis lipoprotein